MESPIRTARETEFYQGYIRFKMSVTNESPYIVSDVTLDFIFDENLLHIADHGDYPVKNGKFVLGNIYGRKSKSITILFEPLTCAKAADIKCQVTYADHEGNMTSIFMEPKEISVVCPIMKTDSDINIGRLKEFIEELPSKDSRVYEIKSGFDVKKLAHLAREVVEKHDVRHIRTLHTRDGRTCEIWYYGRTKVSKDDIVIRVSILTEHQTMELFAATRGAEALTGLLAEVGRDLKQVVEDKASGRVVNVHIKDSLVQRSNLLDMCDMDGTCDVNVVIEDSVVQRSSVASVDEEARLRREQEKREEAERKAQEAARLKVAEEAEKKRKAEAKMKRQEEEKLQKEQVRKALEKEQQAAKPALLDGFDRPLPSSKSRNLPPTKLKSSKKVLLVPMLIIVLIAGYLIVSPIQSGNSDNAVTTVPSNPSVPQKTEVLDSSPTVTETKPASTEDKTVIAASTQDSPNIRTNSIDMEFVLIPAAEFKMGSEDGFNNEEPVHEVTIGKAFYLGKYEVTQKQWVEVMGSNPSKFKGDGLPVEQVSWNDVQEFIKKLNEKEGSNKYRLPSEAEWEYACRAGTTTHYSFGDSESKLGEYAWYQDNSGSKIHPVGQKKQNQWGLYDMHGNVYEWMQDRYHSNYEGAPTDGSAWEDGSSSDRVVRSGGWGGYAGRVRSALRSNGSPDVRSSNLGFRLLREQ